MTIGTPIVIFVVSYKCFYCFIVCTFMPLYILCVCLIVCIFVFCVILCCLSGVMHDGD